MSLKSDRAFYKKTKGNSIVKLVRERKHTFYNNNEIKLTRRFLYYVKLQFRICS